MQKKAISEGGVLVGMCFTCLLFLKTLGLELLSVTITMILFTIFLLRNKNHSLLFIFPYSILVFLTSPVYETVIYTLIPLTSGYIGYKLANRSYKTMLITLTITLFVFTILSLVLESFITNISLTFIREYFINVKNTYNVNRLKALVLMSVIPGCIIVILSYAHINARLYYTVLARYNKNDAVVNSNIYLDVVFSCLLLTSIITLMFVNISIYLDFALIVMLTLSIYVLICSRFWKTLNRRALKD